MGRDQWAAAQPVLTPENELVLRVWRFCGGWHPEIVPVAAAYYGADDLDALLAGMITVRDRLDEQRAAERAADEQAAKNRPSARRRR